METHLTPKPFVQVNKIASSCEICGGHYNTQYCMENLKQAFVDYASSHIDEAGDARLSKSEANFKQQQSKMTNKIDTLLKAINDRITGALASDTLPVLEVLAHAPMYNAFLDKYVESLKLGKYGSAFIQGEMPKKMKNIRLFTLPCRLGDSKTFDTLVDLGSCVNLIPLYLFKTLNIGILEETENVLRLANGTKSYPVGIVKNLEVYVGKLKLLEDFYIIDMEKDPTCPLLVGRQFLVTASAVIDCKKVKIAVGEGVTRLIFGVKKIGVGHVNTPYWTTFAKQNSYESRPSTNFIGARPIYYLEKDILNDHLLGELEIAKDAELNLFKDFPMFRKMVEFLGAIPINFKGNMWESDELIKMSGLVGCNKKDDGTRIDSSVVSVGLISSEQGYGSSVSPVVGAAAVALPAGVLKLDTPSSSEADPSSDTKMPERHVLPTPHNAMLTRTLTMRKSVRPLCYHRLALSYTSHHLDHFTSGSSSDHSSSDHSSSGHSILGYSLSGHTPPDTTIVVSSAPPRFV
ncbi:MAK10-like protein [Tanacetum coccineum]